MVEVKEAFIAAMERAARTGIGEGRRGVERAGEAAVGAELANDFLGNAYALFPAS